MAVETRYVVIRSNRDNEEKEVMTFTDKRSADDYDKMLDMADAMFEVLHNSEIDLPEQQCEELSVFLAKQREEVLVALQAKKKPSPPNKKASKSKNDKQTDLLDRTEDSSEISEKSLSATLLEDVNAKAETKEDSKLVDFVIEKDDAA
jgi:dsDNA-binding SOS-regulon protein